MFPLDDVIMSASEVILKGTGKIDQYQTTNNIVNINRGHTSSFETEYKKYVFIQKSHSITVKNH